MIVCDGGEIVGTVGGAAVEMLAIERAKTAMLDGQVARLELNLNDLEGDETGMICGGRVELLIEPFGVGPRLLIFGAGHVAQPTAALARQLGFSVTVHDERPEWATVERFPDCQLKVGRIEDLAEHAEMRASDFIIIMTHCHADDYKVLTQLLGKPFWYLGVIGSRRKGVEIRGRLKEDGFGEEHIARLTCPIGLEIGSHTPMEIAVSVAAQLIKVRAEWQGKDTKDVTAHPSLNILHEKDK